jgi:phosphatidate cytidylyltransferase
MGVKDVTEHPVNDTQKSNLTIRIISALVMMPVVVATTYLGYPYFNLLVCLCAVLMAWEYSRMISGGRFGYDGGVLIIGLVGAVLLASIHNYSAAFLLLGVEVVVFLSIDVARRFIFNAPMYSPRMEKIVKPANSLWMAAGVAYMGGACVGLIWMRNDWDNGLLVVIWILVLVWASDSGAYAAGRLIGGPKLAPTISPNKTWAGLAGCVVSAGIVGAVVAQSTYPDTMYWLIAISALIGLVSQIGDLVESAIKRRFGVKDSSNLIPGHGGVLDRVDALLAAIFATALISLINKGPLLS